MNSIKYITLCITFVIIALLLPLPIHYFKRLYWSKFHEHYGKANIVIRVPEEYWLLNDNRFWLYDNTGNVRLGTKTKREAIEHHKITGLYITKVPE